MKIVRTALERWRRHYGHDPSPVELIIMAARKRCKEVGHVPKEVGGEPCRRCGEPN